MSDLSAQGQRDTSRSAAPQQLRSVAERLNVFQDLEARERNFEQFARDVTNNLFILLRSAGLYDLDNQALDQPYTQLLQSIKGLHELLRAPIALRMNDGNFFVNRRQVKLDFSTFQNARYLIKMFERLEINELSFDPEVSRADLKQLLSTFVRVVKDQRGHFLDAVIPNVQGRMLKIGEVHEMLKGQRSAERVLAWYATLRFTAQNFYRDASQGRVPEYAQLKRSLLTLIELPNQVTPLLGCLDLLPERAEESGALYTHSVEAAGITQVIAEALELNNEVKLSLATAALQLFQGWTLLSDGEIDPRSPSATREVFQQLESPLDTLRSSRNEIVRTLLHLGGISESVITRSVITYEAQRGVTSAWDLQVSGATSKRAARPSRASGQDRLYPSGLGRSFLTDIVYASHLYVHIRREEGCVEAMRALRRAALLPEIKRAAHEVIGDFAVGSAVELNDGRLAIVTQAQGDQVKGVAVVSSGDAPRDARVTEDLVLRPSTPVQVKRALPRERQRELSRETRRALLFSVHAYD